MQANSRRWLARMAHIYWEAKYSKEQRNAWARLGGRKRRAPNARRDV